MSAETAAVVKFRRRLAWKREYWWYAPLGVQWLVMMAYSVFEYSRFALTHDFALYWQAVWLIAHGHLNPYSTVGGWPFVDNHFELIMWPVAILYWIWPHASLLLFLQDTALVAAEWFVLKWARSWASSQAPASRLWLRGLAVVLCVANPWVYWASAFDFHSEALMTLSVAASAYALWRKNYWALAIWGGVTLLCGDVGALLVVGLGITALLQRRWIVAPTLIGSGLGWLLFISAIGADKGSAVVGAYGYLFPQVASFSMAQLILHLITHPTEALSALWLRRANLWANVSAPGILGVLNPWGIGVVLTALVPSTLAAYGLFAYPGFQNIIIVPLVTMGTVAVVGFLGRRIAVRWLVPTVSVLLAANTLAWSVAWVPHLASEWIRVEAAPAQTLRNDLARIPPNAELIAPQAVLGRFAGRVNVIEMGGATRFRLSRTQPNYVLMAPYQGLHLANIAEMASQLDDLAHSPRASLIWEHHGVYLWRIRGTAPLTLPPQTTLPAWAFQSQVGRRVVGSPPKDWYVAGLGHNGNVLDQAYWREPDGTYRVAVSLSGWGPAQIQVWDASTGYLVANHYVTLSNGHKVTDSYTFVFKTAKPSRPYAGWGPWSTKPIPGPKNNQLEVRVYAQGSSMVNVYTVGLTRSGA